MTEHKDFNMMSIYEYMIGIETDLVFIEKLQKIILSNEVFLYNKNRNMEKVLR